MYSRDTHFRESQKIFKMEKVVEKLKKDKQNILATVKKHVSPKNKIKEEPKPIEFKKADLNERISKKLTSSAALIQNNIKLRKEYSTKLQNLNYQAPFTYHQIDCLFKKTNQRQNLYSRQSGIDFNAKRAFTQENRNYYKTGDVGAYLFFFDKPI